MTIVVRPQHDLSRWAMEPQLVRNGRISGRYDSHGDEVEGRGHGGVVDRLGPLDQDRPIRSRIEFFMSWPVVGAPNFGKVAPEACVLGPAREEWCRNSTGYEPDEEDEDPWSAICNPCFEGEDDAEETIASDQGQGEDARDQGQHWWTGKKQRRYNSQIDLLSPF